MINQLIKDIRGRRWSLRKSMKYSISIINPELIQRPVFA